MTAAALADANVRRDELTERLIELQPSMKRLFGGGMYRELADELHSVTIHQLTALAHLKGRSITMRELARFLDVSESSATAVTDRLVRQGLVERRSDPNDRRVVRLALSSSGTTLVERLEAAASSKTAELVAVLTDAQLGQLVDILEALTAATGSLGCAPTSTGATS